MHVSKPDAFLSQVIAAAFPSYKGKKIVVEEYKRPIDVRSSWDGGSRTEYAFVRLADFAVLPVPSQSAFDRKIAGADAVTLQPGTVCVSHSIFRGKDMGVTVQIHPENAVKLLTPTTDAPTLSKVEKVVLSMTATYKSAARREYAARLGVDAAAFEAGKSALMERGLLTRSGGMSPEGRNTLAAMKLPREYDTAAWAAMPD